LNAYFQIDAVVLLITGDFMWMQVLNRFVKAILRATVFLSFFSLPEVPVTGL